MIFLYKNIKFIVLQLLDRWNELGLIKRIEIAKKTQRMHPTYLSSD